LAELRRDAGDGSVTMATMTMTQIRVHKQHNQLTNQPDTKSNPNPNRNPNHTDSTQL